ncbi:MAG: PAS domain S-box protein [Candidatus Deferrimicrobiaceae bacterium]
MEHTKEFLSSLLDNITEQIAVVDPNELKIVYANRSFQTFYGLSLSRLRKKHCYEVMHRRNQPCDGTGCECPVKKILETGDPSSVIHVHLDKDGNREFILVSAIPVRDRKGRINHVIKTLNKITEQTMLQEDLRKKSELFEKILRTSPDGIIGNDKKGNIFLFNLGAERIYGYSRDEVIGKINVSHLYPPGGAREVKEYVCSEHFGGRGELQDFETEVLTKNRGKVPIRLSCTLLYDQGVEVGTIGFFHDISARKALKQRQLESEESYRSIFESADDAIISIGEHGDILKANLAAEEMLAYGNGELIGRSIREVLPDEYMDIWVRIRTRNPRGKTGGETKNVELSARKKTGGEIPVHVSLSENTTPGKNIITAILRDISERKAFEEELRLLSITDSLTKLFNRRHFLSLAQKEMERANRTKVPFSILLIDLDRFKSYNDAYGHMEGDRLLIAAADLARETFREMDSVFRFGGEEFLILLPDTRATGAMTAAERFRRRLSETRFTPIPGGEHAEVTASIGIAVYQEGSTPDELVRSADLAMYAAKSEGRNRVVSYEQLPLTSSVDKISSQT